jgi:hypothetical protein
MSSFLRFFSFSREELQKNCLAQNPASLYRSLGLNKIQAAKGRREMDCAIETARYGIIADFTISCSIVIGIGWN